MGKVKGILAVFLTVLWSVSALAAPCERFLVQANAVAAQAPYALAHGESVRLQFGEEPGLVDAIFLGRLVTIDGVGRELAFYEPGKDVVHLLPLEKVTIARPDGSAIAPDQAMPIVRSINQEGGTCAAFSVFNCMRQLHYWGLKGNDKLGAQLAAESGRTGLLARLIDRIYVDTHSADHVLRETASAYGYNIYEIPYDRPDELKGELLKYLRQGWPVLIRFDVPQQMSTTSYTIIDRANDQPMERRLWTPKGRWERRKAGHMVLALGVFEAGGRQKILISDPNWQAPRFWDVEELDKAKSASIAAYVAWQEQKR